MKNDTAIMLGLGALALGLFALGRAAAPAAPPTVHVAAIDTTGSGNTGPGGLRRQGDVGRGPVFIDNIGRIVPATVAQRKFPLAYLPYDSPAVQGPDGYAKRLERGLGF